MIVVKTKMEAMPTSCRQCFFYRIEYGAPVCTATYERMNGLGGVANECPLTEIADEERGGNDSD